MFKKIHQKKSWKLLKIKNAIAPSKNIKLID
ncbi:MAG: hypothetical protein ACD_3C00105G0013 [uncultured bacterium (gcode 4)]|uniref:Uncharacterized protein n=1 Tax=uncultured bacterium (gcode 4) TaxID=1234023 RepID=K2GXF9_9BACT|nr:MAG: hypothetical protein ACD_3C00105G0013 [uncultured bacterium (gcode 4)]